MLQGKQKDKETQEGFKDMGQSVAHYNSKR